MKILKNKKLLKIVFIAVGIVAILVIIIISIIKNTKEDIVIYREDDSLSVDIKLDEILVNVTGEVNKPGIYSIKSGSIILDAIRIAGGFTDKADEDSVNLIGKVKDGDKILVKRKDSENIEGLININTATVKELMTLNGIGEAKASAIITYRTQNGLFNSIEEIMNVQGITESIYLKIKDSITVK